MPKLILRHDEASRREETAAAADASSGKSSPCMPKAQAPGSLPRRITNAPVMLNFNGTNTPPQAPTTEKLIAESSPCMPKGQAPGSLPRRIPSSPVIVNFNGTNAPSQAPTTEKPKVESVPANKKTGKISMDDFKMDAATRASLMKPEPTGPSNSNAKDASSRSKLLKPTQPGATTRNEEFIDERVNDSPATANHCQPAPAAANMQVKLPDPIKTDAIVRDQSNDMAMNDNSLITQHFQSAPAGNTQDKLPEPIRTGARDPNCEFVNELGNCRLTTTARTAVNQAPGMHKTNTFAYLEGALSTYHLEHMQNEKTQALEMYLQNIYQAQPAAFETVVGLFFQHSGIHPEDISTTGQPALKSRGWIQDPRKWLASSRGWQYPADPDLQRLMAEIENGGQAAFARAIRWWSTEKEPQSYGVARVLEKAGWVQRCSLVSTPEWSTLGSILKMIEGPAREQRLAQARTEAPEWVEYCLKQGTCGQTTSKRKVDDAVEEHIYTNYSLTGKRVCVSRVAVSSRWAMTQVDNDRGRPTQFHNVPAEERATDSKGNKLPWALIWPDGHPNAHGQKRYVDEKGSFGKSSRRKGSSRTRTATPARKENPTLDGFEKALQYDLQRKEAQEDATAVSRIQNEGNAPSHHTLSVNKEPTQVYIYGYSTNTQWAALDYFEKTSFGMICEDYERQPPSELRKYPNTYSASPRAHARPLTKAERALAFKYAGGNHWVKITFDSAEAAERAMENSPAQICGHWVHAQPYRGSGPDFDEAIPIREDERKDGKPMHRAPQTIGTSFAQRGNLQQRNASTLPRSFNVNGAARENGLQLYGRDSPSSSTATSATATGANYPDLGHRNKPQVEPTAPISQQSQNSQMMKHFPDVPRTALRPAHEAFLPVPTWWERQMQWLAGKGLIPGEIIGNSIPLTQSGEFDWMRASFYWKFFYWIDSHLGTDYCGLKDNE